MAVHSVVLAPGYLTSRKHTIPSGPVTYALADIAAFIATRAISSPTRSCGYRDGERIVLESE